MSAYFPLPVIIQLLCSFSFSRNMRCPHFEQCTAHITRQGVENRQTLSASPPCSTFSLLGFLVILLQPAFLRSLFHRNLQKLFDMKENIRYMLNLNLVILCNKQIIYISYVELDDICNRWFLEKYIL